MISKTIKDHPIVVGDYDQWLVSNSGKKETLEAKTLKSKVKFRVDELSSTSTSTTKSISKLKTMVAAAKKAEDQVESKVGTLNK